MMIMSFRSFRHFAAYAVLLGLTASLSVFAQDSNRRGRKYKAPPPTSRIEVAILRHEDSKPIENAAVVFHMIGDKGNMELKTNEDGKTIIDVLPIGSKVLVQVIAKGYQTYGGEYDIDKAEMTIEVKLKRPGQQYSIYDNHPESAADKAPEAGKDKPTDAEKGGDSKDAGKNTPAESAKQSDARPDATQPQPQ